MSTTTTQTALPDLAAVKARQQKMWASGNYAAVAARIVSMAEHLAEAADLRPGDRVLDVATGSGNAALAAARYGAEVTGVDYVPELLERARARAAAEGLEITFAEGDAEDLAFPDASFDAVLSALGVMFAPDQERAAAELVRVCRPGGTIGLVNWTPAGFIGQLLKTVTRHVPPPAGVRPPSQWGTEERCASCSATRCRAWRSPGAATCSASAPRRSSPGSSRSSTARPARPSRPSTRPDSGGSGTTLPPWPATTTPSRD
jgi:SAM-dependent methyltransferase